MVGNDLAPIMKIAKQVLTEPVSLLRIAPLVSARQRIQVSSRIGLCRKIGQIVGNHLRRRFKQFVIVWTRKQVLAILVGLPWRIQDAGDKARGLRRKERPELA